MENERGRKRDASGGRSTEKIVIDNRRVLFLLVTRAESRTSALSIAIASRKRLIFPPNLSGQARLASSDFPPNLTDFHCRTIFISRKKHGGTASVVEKSCYTCVQGDSEICIDIYLLKDVNKLKNKTLSLFLSHRVHYSKINKVYHVFARARNLKSKFLLPFSS